MDILLSPIKLNELELLIENSVQAALSKVLSTEASEIIDRKELQKRLNITQPTVTRWSKRGKIPEIHIGSHIRYNWPAVVKALENDKD